SRAAPGALPHALHRGVTSFLTVFHVRSTPVNTDGFGQKGDARERLRGADATTRRVPPSSVPAAEGPLHSMESGFRRGLSPSISLASPLPVGRRDPRAPVGGRLQVIARFPSRPTNRLLTDHGLHAHVPDHG